MCRNIKTFHNFKPPATDDEIRASALQFVRKLSGFTRPSKANQLAFERAVDEVARSARELLDTLITTTSPRIACVTTQWPCWLKRSRGKESTRRLSLQ